MTSQREQLARYQADLLDLLYTAQSAADASESIRQIAAEADLPTNLQKIDPRMVDVAMHLRKKWGVIRRDATTDEHSAQ